MVSKFLRGDAHEHRQDPVRSLMGHESSTGMAAITGSGRFPAPNRSTLTYRLRTETCLSVHASKLYHMGFRPVRRSLACQRKARLAYPCGVGPAAHHPGEDAVRRRSEPDQYRLRPGLDDHRSVPVGLSVGALPHHQGGGEDAHAARPAGQHSEFYPHLGWQAARRSCPRYALAGSRSHLRRGSWLRRLCPPLCVAPSRGLLRHACQVEHRCSSRPHSAPTDRSTGIICDQTISLDGFYTRQDYPELLRRIRFKDPESGKTLVFITNNFSLPAAARSTKAAGRWNSSSSGSSSIFGSSSSTARRR